MKKLTLLILFSLLQAAPVLAADVPTQKTTFKHPVAITTGNTFQTILPSNGRNSLTIQNNNATDSCWIDFGVNDVTGAPTTAGTATKANSILLLAGGSLSRYWPIVPTDEIEGTCATTGDTLRVEYQ